MKLLRVACSLSSAQLRKREASLLVQFRSTVTALEELADGYAFSLPGDGRWIRLGAELMVAERECCPFLRFEVVAEADHGPVVVRITGPEGTKEFLRGILLRE
jgi:hypothetical protein